MSNKIRLVVPEAPPTQAPPTGRQRGLRRENLRLGTLDNSKGNADHLLRFVVEGLKAALPVKSVLALRKPYASIAATDAVLDQFTEEADFVIIAMAD